MLSQRTTRASFAIIVARFRWRSPRRTTRPDLSTEEFQLRNFEKTTPATLLRRSAAMLVIASLHFGPASSASAAGPCAANLHFGGNAAAVARSFAAAFHTGCTAASPSGAATQCNLTTNSGVPYFNALVAVWPSAAARTNDPVGGCVFMCNNTGTCRVGNDGLPVELLHFAVE